MPSALVVFSGGQDSTTCLFWALQQFSSVRALTFDYRQRHRVEIEAARRIAAHVGVPHEVVDLGPLFDGLSPLTNPGLDVERYTDAASLPGGLEKTFVPGRNILFLAAAANRAYTAACETVVLGVAEEDFGGYPDCRADFIRAMEAAISLGLGKPLTVATPLMHRNKRQTVELAKSLPGCLEALAWSHTCYNGTVPPCGHCHACLLRARGFAEAGVPDPLLVRQ